MTKKQAIKYWFDSAKMSVRVAKSNYKMKHYDWCLFFWHLTLEKTLKGLIISVGITPPPVHDLNKLARIAKIGLTDIQVKDLNTITNFNLEARYDDYKFTFYKKASKDYAQLWSKKAEKLYLWLKKQA